MSCWYYASGHELPLPAVVQRGGKELSPREPVLAAPRVEEHMIAAVVGQHDVCPSTVTKLLFRLNHDTV